MVSESTLKRTKRFESALNKLRRMAGFSFKDYDSDTDKQDIAERNLQVTIETVVDIGQKIISAKGWEIPDTYRDVVKVLEDNGVIRSDVSEKMTELVSLRNIIVHAYAEIKNEIVYEVLKSGLFTLESVLKKLLKYCKQNEIDP